MPSWQSNVRPLGIGSRLVFADPWLFWVSWTAGIENMIDCYKGSGMSLASTDDYQLLARGLAVVDTMNAFFSSESQSSDNAKRGLADRVSQWPADTQQRFENELNSSVRLKRYSGLATGVGIDENGSYLGIVLVNPDAATAAENADLLEQKIARAKVVVTGQAWSSLVEHMEITSDGRLTLAKLYGSACDQWDGLALSSYASYDPLLVSE